MSSNPFATAADVGGFGDFDDEFAPPEEAPPTDSDTDVPPPPPPPQEAEVPSQPEVPTPQAEVPNPPVAALDAENVIIEDKTGDEPDRAPSQDPSPPKASPPAPTSKTLSAASSHKDPMSGSGSVRRLNHNPFSSKNLKASAGTSKRNSLSSAEDDFAFSDDDKPAPVTPTSKPPPPTVSSVTTPPVLMGSDANSKPVPTPQQPTPTLPTKATTPPPTITPPVKAEATNTFRVADTNPFASAEDDFEFGGDEEEEQPATQPPSTTNHNTAPTHQPVSNNNSYQQQQPAPVQEYVPQPQYPPTTSQQVSLPPTQHHGSYPPQPTVYAQPPTTTHQQVEQQPTNHRSAYPPVANATHPPIGTTHSRTNSSNQYAAAPQNTFSTPSHQRPSDHWQQQPSNSGNASRESSAQPSSPTTSATNTRRPAAGQAMGRAYEPFVPRSTSSTFGGGASASRGTSKQPFTPLHQKSPGAFAATTTAAPPLRGGISAAGSMFDVASFLKVQKRAPKVALGLGGRVLVARGSSAVVTTVRSLFLAEEGGSAGSIIPQCRLTTSSEAVAYASLFGPSGTLPRKPLDVSAINSNDVRGSLMKTFEVLHGGNTHHGRRLRRTEQSIEDFPGATPSAAPRGQYLFNLMAALCDNKPFDWYGGESGATSAADVYTILQNEADRSKKIDKDRLAQAGFNEQSDDPFQAALEGVPPHRVFTHALSNTRPPYNQHEDNMPFAAEEAHSIAEGLVQAGDRDDALRCALHYKQYTLALLLAVSSGDLTTYNNVIREVVSATMDPTSTLASAVLLQHDMKPHYLTEDLTNPAATSEMARSWATHLSMLVSNSTTLTPECLIRWGDMLLEQAESAFPPKPTTLTGHQPSTTQTSSDNITFSEAVEAAHFCYLLAQLHPNTKQLLQLAQMNDGQPASINALQLTSALKHKYNLLGGHYVRQRCRSSFLSPSTVLLTEALEYARQKDQQLAGKPGGQVGDKYIRPQLVPFRCVMAMLHAEMSSMDAACDYIRHVLHIIPPAAGSTTIKTVSDVAENIRLAFEYQGASAKRGDEKGTAGAGFRIGNLWPFGGGGNPGVQGAVESKKASPQPAPEKAKAHTQQQPPPQQPQPLPPKQQQLPPQQQQHQPPVAPPVASAPPPTETKQPAKFEATKATSSSNGKGDPKAKTWSSWLSLGRGKPAPKKKTEEEEEEAKPMHLDTDSVPVFNPKTGKYEFPESEEEKKIRELASRPPPPKMPMPNAGAPPPPGGGGAYTGGPPQPYPGMQGPPAAYGGFPPPAHGAPPTGYPPQSNGFPPPSGFPPQQQFGGPPMGPPPPMGGQPHVPPMAPRYVDSFNS